MADKITTAQPELSTMGPTMSPPPITEKAAANPFFVNGADDRPTDTRIVAVAVSARGELKVGDREFSCALSLHEVVVLRAFYDARAGNGSIRINAGWPPALLRERSMTHSDLAAEVKRMRETYVVPKQNQQIVKCFDAFFGTEPTQQLKRMHSVMRDQYEAWRALVAKAMGRLAPETAQLHPAVRQSMAYDLITEREMEEVILIADPARKGLDSIQLPEIDITVKDTPPAAVVAKANDLDAVKAAADALADAEDRAPTAGEALAERLGKQLDAGRAVAIGELVDRLGANVPEDELIRVLGSKAKLEFVKASMRA